MQNTWVSTLLEKANIHINGNNPWDITVHNPAMWAAVLVKGSLGLGESYMQGWWDCKALDEFFYQIFKANLAHVHNLNFWLVFEIVKSQFFNLQKSYKAFNIAKVHYNLGNDFFTAMLGPTMAYSCGYWKEATTLDQAQTAKFELICRKLHLQKGQKILDIGSGWGSFAKYAASTYGVKVLGITVSKEQLEFAKNLCKGLPVEFRLQDYRNLQGSFDHVVSVGMFEHVGHKNYTTYLQTVKKCLKENGLFLLHTIGYKTSGYGFDPWINKYIFPDGQIPSLNHITKAAEHLFVIEDIHNFGADYDKTLMAWHKNFENGWSKFSHHYSLEFYRMWRYYLLVCAAAFRARETQLWQMVLSGQGVTGGYNSVR